MTPTTYIQKILPFFPKAEIVNDNTEIVIEPKNNIFFRIDNIVDDIEFDYKILEYCSRSACKGLSTYWQNYMRRGINSYFKTTWSKSEMELIYTKLGNGVHRALTIEFVSSNFNLNLLR